MAEYNDVVYVIYSETDYNTNTSNHTLYSYNAKTNKKEETSFLQMPEELKTRIFYMLSINPENGDFMSVLPIIILTEIYIVSRKTVLLLKNSRAVV